MTNHIRDITWDEIYKIWHNHLWPNRPSPIESHSAMMYLSGHSIDNFKFKPHFIGYFSNDKLVGVNSGHKCIDGSYRSRGLWVHPDHRGQGLGQMLLRQIIEFKGNAHFVWSYPRQTSWSTYENVGFKRTSDWQASETSEANAFCIL
jgi:GNAT superfamily N-acetyltransferase